MGRLAKLLEFCRQQKPEIKSLKDILKSNHFGLILKGSELLPLTSDLRKLSIFLQNTAEEAFNQLQLSDKNCIAYTTLKKIVYCQIILLQVEKLRSITLINDGSGNDKFEKCFFETEKNLLNSYSQIVIRGKRGRGVPTLLSPAMKKHFDYFISIRNNYVVNNKYIFHTAGSGNLDDTKILYKYALKCGVNKPKSISATNLRKHPATITKLLQFSEADMEQLSKFMGHTRNTHCKIYRLSDNIYQTAKVSKLLLLMSEGGVEQYKGKSLDEIDIDLSPITEQGNDVERLRCNNTDIEEEELCNEEVQKVQTNTVTVSRLKITKQHIRRSWSRQQKQAIYKYFLKHIEKKHAPK
ncbi:hypothetical protein FQA39_LY00681 [Lamprigera yunnana]|nr:hypothetical protein FQA39_LY00681 [Lamprigera yunnana]